MADEILKESDTAVRIKDTDGQIVELKALKEELASIDRFIQERTDLHNRSLAGLNAQKVLIESRINQAIQLGVKDEIAVVAEPIIENLKGDK